ncbi:DUF4387 domain-containing protein [Paludibacterium purpuratum]|uniref:Uncharacterized protein DUF4387 n=1 Tax=Paludibacterium purpuratum TaxID=1144873 RepID=A0A4R7BCR4_9NEIS|nr:DUF4387 domain-containing protein [Paludibacterium purpuratum]TDR82751.1 uncharacterized protein DUF4387 [Paludibacterium purpuratum]
MKYGILDIARVVRSKNSGPFELVLDIMFKDHKIFETLRETKQINKELIAAAYRLTPEDIHNIVWFAPAHAVKVVMHRRIVSGAPGDSDVYGAQQHAPLLGLTFEL